MAEPSLVDGSFLNFAFLLRISLTGRLLLPVFAWGAPGALDLGEELAVHARPAEDELHSVFAETLLDALGGGDLVFGRKHSDDLKKLGLNTFTLQQRLGGW